MVQAENTQAFMIQLPWTVPEQPNVQAIVLQPPKEQKIYLDLAHSTDWVVAASIFISALISFLGFIATICIVMKSTQQNIESNKILIESQNELKVRELKISNSFNELSKFREIVSEYYYWALKVNDESVASIHAYYNLNLTDKQKQETQEVVRVKVSELNALIAKLMIHLDYDKELHNTVRIELFKVQKFAFDLYASIGTDFQNAEIKLNEFAGAFGYTQGVLNTLIKDEMSKLY